MKKHTHTYDACGKMTCCCAKSHTPHQHSKNTDAACDSAGQAQCSEACHTDSGGSCSLSSGDDDEDGGCCAHTQVNDPFARLPAYLPPLISFTLLLFGLTFTYLFKFSFFSGVPVFVWYAAAYMPVAYPVLLSSLSAFKEGDYFNEFSLMTVATLGAFAIGEYPEGVAVMLFYSVGEWLQGQAVKSARNNIKALLDIRPKIARVWRHREYMVINPEAVVIDETIQVKVGESIPLDGVLLSEKAELDTAALTGESRPQSRYRGQTVMAGMINLQSVVEVQVKKGFHNSSIARILSLVQEASNRKSKTELLVRKLAKIYTPIVTGLAVLICLLPALFVNDYVFSDWFYRALIFLVISCPCALVISIPLGYFGGLGMASKNGLLLKGAMFLDQLAKINRIAMDKTGTVTQGTFTIQDIVVAGDIAMDEKTLMTNLMALERQSNHPIAKAILQYPHDNSLPAVKAVKEIAGKGLTGILNGQVLLAGNQQLMQQFAIDTPDVGHLVSSVVMVALDGRFIGYVSIADELKPDAKTAIAELRSLGIKQLVMLSGDKDSITQSVADELGLDKASGDLQPEDKLNAVERLKQQPDSVVAFVGDGINDAPVLAAADVGLAMGGLGSDVAIETADVVIQSDELSKIAAAIRIGHATRRVIWQNIGLAFAMKGLVLILGAMGMANMWGAVFADVGVALLAILNAVRLQTMRC
ncbi:MAG: cadmium-translocating P-type ATPase [Gammaproteobacteria bacterium]|nr:MAG: cadmium-translocating P-type ATPase [Gammaproteobacteria bacterium]